MVSESSRARVFVWKSFDQMCSGGELCEETRSLLRQLLRDVEKDADQSMHEETLCQDSSFAGGSPGCAGVSVMKSDEKEQARRRGGKNYKVWL